MFIKALKRYGQNFLTDENIIEKIITEFSPAEHDFVVEIGPGQGALTLKLFDKCSYFAAVEIDEKICNDLKKELPGLKIFNDDILKIDMLKIFRNKKKLRIIGNIPYNITTPLILKLAENHSLISDFMLMLQYDAAERLTAKKGSKDYNASNIIANYYFDINICFAVAPSSFSPKPNVRSAIVKFETRKNLIPKLDDLIFIKFVKASFSARRKTLKNSLQNSIFNHFDFSNIDIDFSRRAEELDITDFIKITKFIQKAEYDRRNQK